MFSGQRVCGLYVKYPYFTSKVYILKTWISTEDRKHLWPGNVGFLVDRHYMYLFDSFCSAFWESVFYLFLFILDLFLKPGSYSTLRIRTLAPASYAPHPQHAPHPHPIHFEKVKIFLTFFCQLRTNIFCWKEMR